LIESVVQFAGSIAQASMVPLAVTSVTELNAGLYSKKCAPLIVIGPPKLGSVRGNTVSTVGLG